jgi:hypothetical protein
MKHTYLSNVDISSWNNKIPQNRDYKIIPRHSNTQSRSTIVFVKNFDYYNTFQPDPYDRSLETNEPNETFRFVFSILSNRLDEFWEIFNKLKNKGFINYVKSSNGTHKNLNYNDEIIQSETKTNHKIKNKEFTRYEFIYIGLLSEIIAHVSLLEQTIEFFSKIWGYDEDGKEYNLLKFPIGSIASPKGDNGKDLIVLNYEYEKVEEEYYIKYIVSEMMYDAKSPIIKYGDVITLGESNLTFSRNGRIDDLLN